MSPELPMAGTRTVIVVGAGATLAQALPTQPSRSKTPPLDSTFFELCRIANLPQLGRVRRYMADVYGIDLHARRLRMEEVFNDIHSDAFSHSPPDGCLDAYWALIRMYTQSLASTTNNLKATGRYGPYALTAHLWSRDSTQTIAFITFNQDLMIEKALEALASTARCASIPWDITRAYAMTFVRTTSVRAGGSDFRSGLGRSIPILKLHGSLNWFYKVRSGTDPTNSLRTPSGRLHCVTTTRIYSSLKFPVRRATRGRRTQPGVPFIIPPIFEKASRYQQAVGPLWSRAAEEIAQADRVVIFGYSFPDTDHPSDILFRRAFHAAANLKELSVIDADPLVAARVVDLSGAATITYYRNVPSYTATN